MKAYKTLIAAALLVMPLFAQAQPAAGDGQRLTPQVMARMFPAGVVSPEYNDDGSVTFRYQSAEAKEVKLDCQMLPAAAPMYKDANGIWTITVTPGKPDIYPYCFLVDGKQVADPNNMFIFPNEGFKNSLLEIPAQTGTLAHDIRPVAHGSLSYVNYFSKSLGATNHAIVYLPPSYMMQQQKHYPVFYLISGTTDTEEVYYKVGRVNYILDNLIAEGAAEEMIVVLPYGNPMKLKPQAPGAMPQMGFGADIFGQDLHNDLMPYVESHFRTINDADHRAIGGFSRGGNQGLMNGLTHLDKFSYLCSYSSFTSTDLPNVYDQAAETNSKIHLFWLGVGTDDFLYGTARDYMEFLDKKGIRSVKEFTHDKFGHTWMNAKYFLDRSLRLLFRPEAAEAAMQQGGQPTPAATGKEQPFTPSVMARLFPRPILSPEYGSDAITFRMKAPDAQQVALVTELNNEPLVMQRDSDGVWQTTLTNDVMSTFTYYFLVDGTPVAAPQNMYLAPSKGFKPSICRHPASPNSFASMGEMPHGTVSYVPSMQGDAWYIPADFSFTAMPVFIQLVPGETDTDESWFKVGAADAIADRIHAAHHLKPFLITTSDLDFMQQGFGQQMEIRTLRAADYKTWKERQQALEALLEALKD